jgi:predicted Zn-dependent protease
MYPADILYFDHYRNEYYAVSVTIANGLIRLDDLKNGARPQLFLLKDCTLRFKDDLYFLYIDQHRHSYLQIPSSNPLYEQLPAIMKVYTKSNFVRRKPALIVAGIVVLLIASYFLLTETFPKIAIQFISVRSEINMGNKLFNGLQEEIKIDQNASAILQHFADQLHLSNKYPIKVSVAVSDDVNAYALPGGHIVVNSAILKEMQKPEELVALLSHESIHINRRHSLQNILSQMGSGFIISMFTNAGGGAAKVLVGNANYLVRMSYSRKLEMQADLEGMVLMEKNRIDPKGMMKLMQRLKEVNDDSQMRQLSFLSSHPLTDDRINDANNYIHSHHFVAQTMDELLVDYWNQIKFIEKAD